MLTNFGKSEIHLDGFNLRKSLKVFETKQNILEICEYVSKANVKVYLYVCREVLYTNYRLNAYDNQFSQPKIFFLIIIFWNHIDHKYTFKRILS